MTAVPAPSLESRVAALEARFEALALQADSADYLARMVRRHGRHAPDCPGGEECPCGFGTALLVAALVLGERPPAA